MKTQITIIIALLIATTSFSQNGINYKAIIKDSNGNAVTNTSINITFSILEGVNQDVAYTEWHDTTTDSNGLIILTIGEGTPTVTGFDLIDWSGDVHFLKVLYRNGNEFIDLGTTEFRAVPYALSAPSNIFKTENNVTSNSSGDITSDNFVFGSTQLDEIPNDNDSKRRLFFDKSKGAFRAGRSNNNSWNEEFVGESSFASGNGTIASGNYSTALGFNSQAIGNTSFAIGNDNLASGFASLATGYETEATANYSTAMGHTTKALGLYSMAIGYGTESFGLRSQAFGHFGRAIGAYSTTFGIHTRAGAYSSVAIGRYNIGAGNPNGWTNTESLFEIGNGSSNTNRSNAFEVKKNGNVYAAGSLIHSSDRRLKEDISDLAYGLDDVLQLQPKAYYWKKHKQDRKSFGLIAQEVQSVIGEIVHQSNPSNDLLSISYTELIPVLINAIKEQQEIITNQDSKIENLSTELTALKSMSQRLKQLESLMNTNN